MRDLLPASRTDSRVRSHSHWRIQAVSSKFSVLRRSPLPSFAMSSIGFCHSEERRICSFFHLPQTVPSPKFHWVHCFHQIETSQKSIFGYLSCIQFIFFSRNFTISSSLIDSRIYVLQRDNRALITVKLGFSVVAPMSVMMPFSTHGRRTSCWDLDQRWISSRKSIVCCPDLKLFCAPEMIFTTSSFFDRTHDRWKNSASSEFAMTRASEVLPQPGGHQRRIDGSLPASMNFRIDLPSQIRCCCPTRSSSFSGLRSDARGVMESWNIDCMMVL